MKITKELISRLKSGELTQKEQLQLREYLDKNGYEEFDQFYYADWDVKSDLYNSDVKESIWKSLPKEPLTLYRLIPFVAAAILLIVGILFYPTLQVNQDSVMNNLEHVTNTESAPKILLLSDSSVVWLAPNATLTYSTEFKEKVRQVELKGEARFQVMSNPSNPFEVIANNIITRATGTEFIINSNLPNSEVEVELIEGIVEIESKPLKAKQNPIKYTLKPGDVFSKNEVIAVIEQPTSEKKEATQLWNEEGVIYFKQTPIVEVANTLSKWYAINITIDDEKIVEKLTYRIDTKKVGLNDIIEGINLVSNYQIIQKENKDYIIKSK